MKKIVAAGLILVLLTAMTGASASEAGTLSDPLITKDYLENTYARELVSSVTQSACASLQAVFDRYSGATQPGVAGAVYTDGRQRLSLAAGQTLTVYTGGLIIPIEGNISASVTAGQLIDASLGRPVDSGSTLAAGRRYVCAEDSAAALTAISSGVFMLEGPYSSDAALTPPSTPSTPSSPSGAFRDVPADAWYAQYVAHVAGRGLIVGDQDGNFNPNDKTGRGQLMTILARLNGVDTSGSNPWYKTGMDWAVSTGISDGTDPLGDLPREQFVTMLYRYMDYPQVFGILSGYPDADDVHEWARDAMMWAIENGIIEGTNEGLLEPGTVASRAVAATILSRFIEKFGL